MEKIAIEYLKSRFEVGSTYAVPREFAEMALTGITGASDVDADVFPQAFYGQPLRHTKLEIGDVVFHMINPRPELRKVYKSGGEARVTSEVLVRAFAPICEAGVVPQEWTLVRWSLRTWCSSNNVLDRLLRSLLFCDKCSERAFVQLSDRRAFMPLPRLPSPTDGVFKRLALPAPPDPTFDDDAAIVPYRGDVESVVFSMLADALLSGNASLGADVFDSREVEAGSSERLAAIGAVTAVHGEVQYSLNPAGISWHINFQVVECTNDMRMVPFARDKKALDTMSKVELLFIRLDAGAKPVPCLEGPNQRIKT